MTSLDKARSAILGNPVSAGKKPERNGLIDAWIELMDEVSAAGSQNTEGIIGANTLAELNALATTLGLGVADNGKLGRVYNDTTLANNGDWKWNGSAWTFLGGTRLDQIANAVSGAVIALDNSMLWDRDGLLRGGAALTLYVPRSLFVSVGGITFNGSTYGAPSIPLPTYTGLVVSDADAAFIYLDLDDAVNPQKIANYATLPSKEKPGKIFILAIIYKYRVVWSINAVKQINNMNKDRVDFRFPIVVEKDAVLFPGLYHRNRGDGVTAQYEPSDGSRYWELTKITSTGTGQGRYIFDRLKAEASETPISVVTTNTQPVMADDNYLIEVASSLGRGIRSDAEVVGYVAGGLIPNMFHAGNDPDFAHLYSETDTSVTNVTNAELLALGIARGITGVSAFYGEYLPVDTPKSGFVFARVYVQATADNDFGNPTLYIQGKTGVLGSGVAMVMEKKLSSRSAIFIFFTQYDYAEPPILFFLGQFNADGRIYCGGQVHLSSAHRGWIARDDRPLIERADVLYSEKHYSVVGRELNFMPSNIISDRSAEKGDYAFNLSRVVSDTAVPLMEEKHDAFKLDYTAFGTPIDFVAAPKRAGNSGLRFTRSVAIVRGTGPFVKSPKILSLGDSLNLFGLLDLFNKKLGNMGLTPEFLGTLLGNQNNTGFAASTPSTILGEGRSGWAFADFTHQNVAFPAINPADVSAYTSLPNVGTGPGTRHGINPMIRLATGGDPPAFIKNGYIFSLASYLSLLSIATPDIILIGLGTNDINEENAAVSLQNIKDGINILVTQCRAAAPSAKIGLWLPTAVRSGETELRWRDYFVPAIRYMLDYVDDLNDANVEVLPTWAHMSNIGGWHSTSVKEIAGSQTTSEISDILHPANLNRQIIAEVISQWIAIRA